MKRFQECNKVIKLFRYRWYLLIPFKYFYFTYIKEFRVYEDKIINNKLVNTNDYYILKGKELFETLKSLLQSKMAWYYTMEEVMEEITKNK